MCHSGVGQLLTERANAYLSAQFDVLAVSVGERHRQPARTGLLSSRVRIPDFGDGDPGKRQAPLDGYREQFRVISLAGQLNSNRQRPLSARRVVVCRDDPAQHRYSVSPCAE